jgi:hypothetical protein
MLSFIILLPTLILEGTKYLVIDCELMLVVNTPPQSLVLKIANQESCIWVIYRVEVTYKIRVADDIKIKYKIEARYKAKQVRYYLGFL